MRVLGAIRGCCAQCQKDRYLRAGGLCKACYRSGFSGRLARGRQAHLPQEPTTAAPGTEAKILVMIERATRREQLFHPRDRK